MPYLLVPLDVSADTAAIWVGAIDERSSQTAALTLEYNLGTLPLDRTRWSRWSSPDHSLSYQRVVLTGLAARTRYLLRLRAGAALCADGEVTTLPRSLPPASEKPFTVLLGSCFCESQDQGGSVGTTYFNLPPGARPDIKILSGDQVYLDAPWYHYLLRSFETGELESRFFDIYRRTWTQSGTASGFQQLLKRGANYFTSDDHELWNNAPNKGVYIRNTWTDAGRDEWLRLARRFYETFQPTGAWARFSVDPLSFFIIDTRMDRRTDQTNLVRSEAFEELSRWIKSLRGPGVLILGQPLFSEKAGWKGNIADWHLPDYDQYAPLVRLIAASLQPIIMLTGDVHFGRVAKTTLPSGASLLEIISSPMALVDKSAEGKWNAAPGLFPEGEIPGMAKAPLRTERGFTITDNHFLTLEFTAVGGRVQVGAKAWPIVLGGAPPISKSVIQPILL